MNQATLALGRAVVTMDWPDGPDADAVRQWVVPLATEGAETFVRNVACTCGAVCGSGWALPVTVTDHTISGNSYVVSPYGQYVRYLAEELRLITSVPVRLGARAIVEGLGVFLRAGRIDRMVAVNNWLLSTNLYPALGRAELGAAIGACVAACPDHAIVFRSVNAVTTPGVLSALRDLGCAPVISRQVYLYDARQTRLMRNKHLRDDLALLSSQGYTLRGVDEVDDLIATRVADLYRMLYLEKYSRLNPWFTPRFVRETTAHGLLHLYVLERHGRIDGVLGFVERDGVMTTPVLGYDTSMARGVGLYRMLAASLSRLAHQRGAFLHRSSGAATFKRSRGARPALEYSLVYTRHLPRGRRVAWRGLQTVIDRIGKPMLETYDH